MKPLEAGRERERERERKEVQTDQSWDGRGRGEDEIGVVAANEARVDKQAQCEHGPRQRAQARPPDHAVLVRARNRTSARHAARHETR
jgi:hypothetical protein